MGTGWGGTGWARGEDGWVWPTIVPEEIPYFSCKMSAIARHLIKPLDLVILIKDHFKNCLK